MFSHIMVGADDLVVARRFYDATMGALGFPPATTDDRGRLFYRTPTIFFAVTKPINGEPASAANGGTLSFAAASPEQAEAWHTAGVANGGTTCEDPPGWRGTGPLSVYLAYLRDPAGNKLCAIHRRPV